MENIKITLFGNQIPIEFAFSDGSRLILIGDVIEDENGEPIKHEVRKDTLEWRILPNQTRIFIGGHPKYIKYFQEELSPPD